ncbi:HPP family protein [Alicyclobacillus sp. SO9]|uniref:CBS domain-containing protein n=1 Tax=Alicyclobacillus sp. SO9 TaxID=2665646 RepID=UPI0018E8AF9D|nr:CBS domain-containing protein [Alicyclobacillus sp. SO9]QQE80753.1 CBS domain-containing protein [Alicyclobacillus sp. SO9]
MFIKNYMTDKSELTVVRPTDSVQSVLQRMEGHLSVPCADDDNKFVGIVSKRTIFEAFEESFDSGITYESFLTQAIKPAVDTTIPALSVSNYFEHTIDVIIRYPFVPVVDGNQFLGIVKRGDINRALEIAFATNVESQRLLLGMAEIEGALHQLFRVTHRLGINVITAIPFDAGPNMLNRRLILRIEPTQNLHTLIADLEKAGFYVVDSGN